MKFWCLAELHFKKWSACPGGTQGALIMVCCWLVTDECIQEIRLHQYCDEVQFLIFLNIKINKVNNILNFVM